MKELSLNILDIAMNSVRAKAEKIEIIIDETDSVMAVTIIDDGVGMTKDTLERVTDPFCTTRTTRKVGLGIPFYKLAAEQTGGEFSIVSKTKDSLSDDSGTTVKAKFIKTHIDCLPLGDIVSTICTLIQGSPQIDIVFKHNSVRLATAELREVLGDVPLSSPEVLCWISEFLKEQYNEMNYKGDLL